METFGGQFRAGAVAETPLNDFDDEFFKEVIGVDFERRADCLRDLETMYGDRVFRYGDYSGTVTDMVSCPAFGEQLEQGAPSAAAWLEANDQPQQHKLEDNKQEEPKELFETAPEDATKQVTEAASQPDKTRTEAEISQGSADMGKSETTKASDQTSSIAEACSTDTSTASVKAAHDSPADSKSEAVRVTIDTPGSLDRKVAEAETGTADQSAITASISTESSTAGDEGALISQPVEKQVIKAPEMTAAFDTATLLKRDVGPTEPVDDEQRTPTETKIAANRTNEISGTSDEAIETFVDALEVVPEALETSDPQKSEIPSDSDGFSPERDDIIESETTSDFDAPESRDIEPQSTEETLSAETDAMDILAVDAERDDSNQGPLDATSDEYASVDGSDSSTEVILDVMKNEIETAQSEESAGRRENETEEPEAQVLHTETLQLLSKILDETPDLLVELSTTELQQQATTTIEIIEILEKAKTAEECRETLKHVCSELAGLLGLLGYKNPDGLADQLVKQYGMRQLKEYIALLMKSLAQSQEFTSGKVGRIKSALTPRHYGTHAVKSLVSLV